MPATSRWTEGLPQPIALEGLRQLIAGSLPDALIGAVHTSMRQRVLIEAPLVARRIPVLYLPRPCVDNRSILDLDRSSELIDPARAVVADFLATAPVPTVGAMSGAPHHHEEPSDIGPTPLREWRTS